MRCINWPAAALCGLAWVVGPASGQDRPPLPVTPAARQTPAQTRAAQQAPRLEVVPPEWDFKEAWYGEKPQGELRLRNVGRGTLEIERVRTSCGCTAAALETRTLAPGESVALRLSYRKNRVGKVAQVVRITSNDPLHPTVTIPVKGRIKPLFEGLAPILLGQLTSDARQSRTIELSNACGQKVFLKLKDVRPNAQYYHVKLTELEPGLRYRLTVATRPPLREGGLFANIRFSTGFERVPELLVPLRATVTARVAVRPRTLWVTPRVPAQRERRVRLTYTAERPVEITRIVASQESISYRLLPLPDRPPSGRFITRVILVKTGPPEQIPAPGARLEIFTNDAEYPRLEVAVRRLTRRGAAGTAARAGAGQRQESRRKVGRSNGQHGKSP